MKIEIKRLSEKARLPEQKTHSAAGMDLYSLVSENMIIPAGEWRIIGTGIAIAIPEGYEAQIRTRSGFAALNGIFVLNSPGTIDADYRGEINVILANFGKEPFEVKSGMRIAQMVINKVERAIWENVEELSETERGINGLGSTGF